ncbi:MAG: c-type cytochrome [Acidobacteriota bacterium]
MKIGSVVRAVVPGALVVLSLAAVGGQSPKPASPAPATAQDAAVSPALPQWAYPAPSPGKDATVEKARAAAAHNEAPQHVPGSTRTFTTGYIADLFTVPDWFPNEHPPMPRPVREGRRPDAYACAYCHLPNGLGRPENESIAGLPKAYILEQVRDFKDGSRHSSAPGMDSVADMIQVAKAATPEEVEAAADYFSRLKLTPWVRVVETGAVPRTHIAGGMLVADGEGREPIGSRIIEVPVNEEQTKLRNPHSGFIAYAPMGSLQAGEALVRTGGNGKTIACAICHGPDLHGLGDVPGIAGRSPSEMARQLMDFRDGARNGPGAALMKLPVSKLSDDDIVAITAYLASLQP